MLQHFPSSIITSSRRFAEFTDAFRVLPAGVMSPVGRMFPPLIALRLMVGPLRIVRRRGILDSCNAEYSEGDHRYKGHRGHRAGREGNPSELAGPWSSGKGRLWDSGRRRLSPSCQPATEQTFVVSRNCMHG